MMRSDAIAAYLGFRKVSSNTFGGNPVEGRQLHKIVVKGHQNEIVGACMFPDRLVPP